ncbi:hypothetical protein BH24CHL4_BH24CHL4_11930 [soil metagenome]
MKAMSSLNTAKNLMQVMRELSLDDIREEAERPPRILVLAATLEDADAIGQNLTGEYRSPYVTSLRLDTSVDRVDAYDAVILFDPEAQPGSKNLIDSISRKHPDVVVVPFLSLDPADDLAARAVRTRILNRQPTKAPSFGRHMPAFVPAAIKSVIDDTAAANAQFAALANLPSVVPIFGTLASVSADFLVLTKNQLLLVYKVAAIHGRDLHDKAAILREMAPVAGAGFFWRTLAREATTLLPMASGTVPKVAIAYSGTVAIGRAADYFYRFDEKPSKELLKSFYKTGMESLKKREFHFRNPKTVDTTFRVYDDRIPEKSDNTDQP